MNWTDVPQDRPVAVVMLLLSLVVLGGVAIERMPIGFVPTIAEPEIDIGVNFPGSQPLEGLIDVAQPIEEELAAIPDVRSLWAGSGNGNVNIEASFDWGVDVDLKKMEVRAAVERARRRLPESIRHISVEGDTDGGSSEVLGGRISAERDLSESWALLDRHIRRPLERVPGVARVNLYGVEPQEVRIDLDLDAVERHGIVVGEVAAAINASNTQLDLGAIRGGTLRYDVRADARFSEVEELAALDIGNGLRLDDIARVALREPRLNYGRHLNRNFAIGFDVFKQPSANTVSTVRALQAKLEEIQRDPNLGGIAVVEWQNQGDEIMESIEGLRNAGIFGGSLALIVLFAFLRRWRTTLIVGVAIPFSLLVTCAAMFLMGMEFNVLTMLGLMLGVGMLVDNAVVVVENIDRLQTAEGHSPDRAARLGPRQVGNAVLAATATTVIVWSWLFVSQPNTMTIMIGQVAIVICLSVACSLLISLTFIPLAAGRMRAKGRDGDSAWMRRVVPVYRRMLGWSLRHRLVSMGVLLLIAASVAIPFMAIDKEGNIQEKQTDVQIHYQIHDSTTVDVIEGYVDQVEEWLETKRDVLDYDMVYSWFEEPGQATTRIYLKRGAGKREFERLTTQIEDDFPVIAGVQLEIGNNRGRQRRRSAMTMVGVEIRGDDPEFLQDLALDAERQLRDVEDVREVFGPSLVGQQEVRIRIDPERARAFGIEPRAVAEVVQFAFRGQQLRRFSTGEDEVPILLGLPEDAQPGIVALEAMSIPNASGQDVALSAVATLERARMPNWINRNDRQTTSWVNTQFEPDTVTGAEAKKRIRAQMDRIIFPDGYSWGFDEFQRDDDEALAFMLRGVLLSLAVVLLLMAGLFESFTQPLAILITLPLAMVGAFWSLWGFGFDLEPIAFIGLIILIGVVVNNGIVLVDQCNRHRRNGHSRMEALLNGCGDRLRPVLMTVITTVVGLIPLAMSEFTVAEVHVQSMAIVIIGGLVSSTIFTLLGLPVWYCAVEDLGRVLAGVFPTRRGRIGSETKQASAGLVGGAEAS